MRIWFNDNSWRGFYRLQKIINGRELFVRHAAKRIPGHGTTRYQASLAESADKISLTPFVDPSAGIRSEVGGYETFHITTAPKGRTYELPRHVPLRVTAIAFGHI